MSWIFITHLCFNVEEKLHDLLKHGNNNFVVRGRLSASQYKVSSSVDSLICHLGADSIGW